MVSCDDMNKTIQLDTNRDYLPQNAMDLLCVLLQILIDNSKDNSK